MAFAPAIVIPAPFAAEESGAPLASVKFKSATLTVVELTVVVVPCTVRFPLTVTSLNVTLSVVPTACPMLITVPVISTPVPAVKLLVAVIIPVALS